MANRPANLRNDAMSLSELRELQRSLRMLSPMIVKEKYKVLADRCRFLELPTPRLMQEFVATWKVLWKWRR